MKKIILSVCVILLIATLFTSCSTMKRDCQGRKHERLSNGIYL